MERWAGRVALVTGASSGIGASVARKLVAEGMKVVGTARNVERIQALADELKGQPGSLIAIKCDLTKDDQVKRMFERIKQKLGGVDVCINNAGVSVNKSLLEGTPEDWRKILDLNVVALCLCTREAVSSMRERGVDDGHIIHVNSVLGHRVIPAGNGFYSGTKHMVTGLTEALRQELRQAKSNIKISAISPGLVDTEMFKRSGRSEQEVQQLFKNNYSLQADDVADTLVHILSTPPHVQIHDVLLLPIQAP